MTTPPEPASLRAHYTHFLPAEGPLARRILLTGHSHQAWPDVARAAQLEAFDDAALHVDDKWGRAFAAADAVRAAVAQHLGVPETRAADVALASNTHELVARVLSACDLGARRHVLSTRGEFHTVFRQLTRLAEAGLEVELVDALPAATLAERLAARVRDDTAAVLVSSVLFETASVVPHLEAVRVAAERHGALVVLDAYHHAGVRAFDPAALGPNTFVVGGGYKYLQWGEGCCFLLVPPGCALRPAYTGWFADFAHLSAPRDGRPVGYGERGAERFAGSTYDPTSHYRARAVADFFTSVGLTPAVLHASYARQAARLAAAVDAHAARAGFTRISPDDAALRGGFVAVRVADAPRTVAGLRARGVFVDARGDVVRLGPAPYLTDDELDAGVAALAEVVAAG
jgi:kynureninase